MAAAVLDLVDLVDIAAVAHTLGMPAGTLRFWAHVDGWTRYGRVDRRTQYDVEQVNASLVKRGYGALL